MNKQKLLALLLGVATAISVMVFPAAAEEPTSPADTQTIEQKMAELEADANAAFANPAAPAAFDGLVGEGTEENPYQITGEPANLMALETFFSGTAPDGVVYMKVTQGLTLPQSLQIPAGFSVVLDLNGQTVSAGAAMENSNLLHNLGNLTVTDSQGTAVVTAYFRVLYNEGICIIDGGTYRTTNIGMFESPYYTSTALLNRATGTLIFLDGTVQAASYGVANLGNTVLKGGAITSTSCSYCSSAAGLPSCWGYTVSNQGGTMFLDENVSVTGIQGGLSSAGGETYILGGTYTTVLCDTHPTSSHYALYVAGEFENTRAYVMGGTFTAAEKVAMLVGNSNDGGLKEPAWAYIYGGTFTGGSNAEAIKVDGALGNPSIVGGTYKGHSGSSVSDVSDYVSPAATFDPETGAVTAIAEDDPNTVAMIEKDFTNYYYTSVEAAIADAQEGETVYLTQSYDGNIVLNKPIRLGCMDDSVTVSGLIQVTAENAGLYDLNLSYTGPKEHPYGNVQIEADNVTLENCDFYANYTDYDQYANSNPFAVLWIPERENITIDNCTFTTNAMGIFPAPKTGTINGCTFAPLPEETGDTRKSVAINGTKMAGLVLTDNIFQGRRILTNGDITVTGNQFLDMTGSVFVRYNENGTMQPATPVDASGNYWGSESPDLDLLAGEDGRVIVKDYYSDVDENGDLINPIVVTDALQDVTKTIAFELEGTNTVAVYLVGSMADGGDAARIENLVTADMTFALANDAGSNLAITGFTPASADWTYDVNGDRYFLYEKGMLAGKADLEGDRIQLGTLTLVGTGSGTITLAADGVAQQRQKTGANTLVSSPIAAPQTPYAISVTPEQANLRIQLAFRHALQEGNTADQNGITLTVKGAGMEPTVYYIGTPDGTAGTADTTHLSYSADGATLSLQLEKGIRYSVEIAAEGYRTFTQSILLDEDKTLNLWNNKFDTGYEVEVISGDASTKRTDTFLAGDIVMDYSIGLYDLSAVVSYFGMEDIQADYDKYRRYDLNRDGVIDSTDVAMVLVSWEEQ